MTAKRRNRATKGSRGRRFVPSTAATRSASRARRRGCRGRSPHRSPTGGKVRYETRAHAPTCRSMLERARSSQTESVLVDWPFEPAAIARDVELRVRVWDRRPDQLVERAARDRSRTARPRRLDGPLRHAGLGRGSRRPAAVPVPPQRVRVPNEHRSRRGSTSPPSASTSPTSTASSSAITSSHPAGRATTTGYACRRSTSLSTVRPGRNAIGAILGDGWYRGRLGPHGGRRNIYGNRLALLAQLEVEHTDGTTTVVDTDESWRAATGPILAADLYDGETYDARLELDRLGRARATTTTPGPAYEALERDLATPGAADAARQSAAPSSSRPSR